MKGNRERALIPLVLLTIVLGVIVGNMFKQSRDELRQAKHEYVYQICNSARLEISADSEEECGRAQDRTGTEFICKQNNQNPSTTCWVEEK